jgi:PEP-CTERM motif-containing protein
MMAVKRVDYRKFHGTFFRQYLLLVCAAVALAIAYAPGIQAQQVTNLTNGGTITLADLGTGNFSILVGDKLFSDFGIGGYNASNITVKGIIENGGDYGIQFQGGFFSMNGFMEVNLSYAVNVTNSDNLISGANLSFNGFEFGSNGVATVTEAVYTNTTLYGDMTVYASPSSNLLSTTMAIVPPQPALSIDKDVFTYAIDLSFASISTINQSFVQVPEPSTIALATAGLTGLLLLRRRKH